MTSIMDNRREPLTSSGQSRLNTSATTSLNDYLDTEYIDLGGADEESVRAQITRTITSFVGNFITPRHLLVVLRVLKAITFCFLVLTLAADLMYIVFLEVLASDNVKKLAGGNRDLIIRLYGLMLAGIAICIELDNAVIVKAFYGFKGFLPRALLLFFISAITGAHPLHEAEISQSGGYNGNQYTDDVVYGGTTVSTSSEIPGSAVVFMMVTSFVLGICGVTYFVFGLLCLDRFTSRAFLSTNDPLVSTAIPKPGHVTPTDLP